MFLILRKTNCSYVFKTLTEDQQYASSVIDYFDFYMITYTYMNNNTQRLMMLTVTEHNTVQIVISVLVYVYKI